jgi:beta-phosphoglucomutase-like phosphatase (HAD superfamily)
MSLPRRVRAVVFDMDGLLVDTEQAVYASMLRASEARGRDMPMDVFRQMVGLTRAASDEIISAHFGGGFDIDAWAEDIRGHMQEAIAAGIALKTGAAEILDHLDVVGLPRAIATSSSLEAVHHSLGPHGVIERFHALITRDVQVNSKPHPEPFLKAASALGIDPADCLALEDSHNGVRAAAAAGMMTVMVPDMLDPTEEMRTLCIRIARDLHEVVELLRGQGG